MAMTIKQDTRVAGIRRRQSVMAAGGVLGALAASSCCILPLVLFSLGVSGAWIGNLTRLAPYQPVFIAATIACLLRLLARLALFGGDLCRRGDLCAADTDPGR
jgi:mercuric ion transport protein